MKIGNLVEITRPSIGIPKGTVGLVLDKQCGDMKYDLEYFVVQLIGTVGLRQPNMLRRYLPRDLAVVS
jgi:hypothetical protein